MTSRDLHGEVLEHGFRIIGRGCLPPRCLAGNARLAVKFPGGILLSRIESAGISRGKRETLLSAPERTKERWGAEAAVGSSGSAPTAAVQAVYDAARFNTGLYTTGPHALPSLVVCPSSFSQSTIR